MPTRARLQVRPELDRNLPELGRAAITDVSAPTMVTNSSIMALAPCMSLDCVPLRLMAAVPEIMLESRVAAAPAVDSAVVPITGARVNFRP